MELSEADVEFETMRSGGPGGQHADRRATAVRLRVSIDSLPLSDQQKNILREQLPPKNLTRDDEILVENGDQRSQNQNRKRALEVAAGEIEQALKRGRQKQERQARKKRINQNKGGGGGTEDIQEKQKKRFRAETTEDLLRQAAREDPEIAESMDENEPQE